MFRSRTTTMISAVISGLLAFQVALLASGVVRQAPVPRAESVSARGSGVPIPFVTVPPTQPAPVSTETVTEPVVVVYVTTTAQPAPKPTTAPTAAPTGDEVWDRLAQCESGGNWADNTGNGYYGGLQFSLSTWHSVGGLGYPHENSREEQINRGKILQARSGWGQWPACSRRLGLR